MLGFLLRLDVGTEAARLHYDRIAQTPFLCSKWKALDFQILGFYFYSLPPDF